MAFAKITSGQSGCVRSISRSVCSAAVRVSADSSFQIEAISCSAPLQGVARTCGGIQTSRTSIIAADTMSLPFRDLQDLIGLDVSQDLQRSAGPAQFNFLDQRIASQSKVRALVGGTRVAARGSDLVVLHQA